MRIVHSTMNRLNALSSKNPFTNVYGFARSILALGTLLTLLLNSNFVLFSPAAGIEDVPNCANLAGYGFFCLMQSLVSLDTAQWIAILILLIVVIGWRPRITCLFHWWVTSSLVNNAILLDGGDQVASILTFLLIPICLLDDRKWHWTTVNSNRHDVSSNAKVKYIIAWITFFAIRLQVAVIYLIAGVGKLKVEEWRNGTALYYYFNNDIFGMSEYIEPVLNLIIDSPVLLTLTTFSVIVLEVILFSGLFMSKHNRKYLLYLGLSFHFMIIVIYGLVSFFIAMSAALILFLRPKDEEFSIPMNKLKLVGVKAERIVKKINIKGLEAYMPEQRLNK